MAHDMTITPTGRRLRASCSCGKTWTLPAYACEVEQHPGANFLAVRAGIRTAFLKAVDSPSSDARGGAQLVRAKLVGSMSVAHAAGVARYLREQCSGPISALPLLPALPSKPERAAKAKVPIVTKTALSPPVKVKPRTNKAQRRAVRLAKKAAKEASRRLLNRQHRERVLNGSGVTPATVSNLAPYPPESPPW